MPEEPYPTHVLKAILVGDSGVGKTHFAQRAAGRKPPEVVPSTVGVDYVNPCLLELSGTPAVAVKVQLWDTAGQERYRSIVTIYYRGAGLVLTLYDVSNRTSFRSVDRWATEFRERSPEAVSLLVAHKTVSRAEGQAKAQELGMLFAEASSSREDATAVVRAVLRTAVEAVLARAGAVPGLRTADDMWLIARKQSGS